MQNKYCTECLNLIKKEVLCPVCSITKQDIKLKNLKTESGICKYCRDFGQIREKNYTLLK